MRFFILLLLIFIFSNSTVSLAHENQLSGLLYLQPQAPEPETPFTITFELYDPEGKFISDALVYLAIPSLDFQKGFTKTSQEGIYEMELTLPKGQWYSDITEATFEGEANTVQFGLKVGEANREIFEILFPVIDEGINQRPWILLVSTVAGLAIVLGYAIRLRTKQPE